MTEGQGWYVIVLLFAIAAISIPLLLIELSAIKNELKTIRDQAFGVASSVDEMRNSLHAMESDTQRIAKQR